MNLLIMMAFSVHRSSDGRALACHLMRSSAVDKYWKGGRRRMNDTTGCLCHTLVT